MLFKHSVPILYSENVRRSLDYYTQVLGFDSKWEWDDPPTFGGVCKNLVEIFFCEKGQGHPGTWLSVMVDNVDEFYEKVKARGARIRSVPENMEWGLREMLVEDPDGHILRFGQSIARKRDKSGEVPEALRIVERAPTVEEYQRLVTAVEWYVKEDTLVEKLLQAPLYAIVAEDAISNKVVGCVLLVGDGASFYYIKDVMVDPAWQGKRVGTALMQRVNEWLETNAADHALVGLYTGENLAPFYRQFGFRESFGMCRRIRREGT
jgi:GNAT superfamily N-acetyltransferase